VSRGRRDKDLTRRGYVEEDLLTGVEVGGNARKRCFQPAISTIWHYQASKSASFRGTQVPGPERQFYPW